MDKINYIDGEWIEGNPAVLGPHDQSFWFATHIFDGARAFEGVAPDLDRQLEARTRVDVQRAAIRHGNQARRGVDGERSAGIARGDPELGGVIRVAAPVVLAGSGNLSGRSL